MRKAQVGRWVLAAGAAGVAAAVAAAGLVVGGPAAPAHATGAPQPFAVTSDLNDEPEKSATVDCPGQSRVFGPGGRINGGNGRVVLTGIVPNETLTSVTVFGRSRPGFTGEWSLTASVVCDVIDVAPRRTLASTTTGEVTAECPGDGRLFGTGFLLVGPDANARVDAVVPDPQLRQVSVHAVTGGPQNRLTAFGVCHPTVIPMRRIEASVPLSGPPPAVARAVDPFPNVVYGVGGLVTGGNAFLDALVADPRDNSATVRAVPVNPPPPGVARVAGLTDDGDGGSVTAYGTDIGMFC